MHLSSSSWKSGGALLPTLFNLCFRRDSDIKWSKIGLLISYKCYQKMSSGNNGNFTFLGTKSACEFWSVTNICIILRQNNFCRHVCNVSFFLCSSSAFCTQFLTMLQTTFGVWTVNWGSLHWHGPIFAPQEDNRNNTYLHPWAPGPKRMSGIHKSTFNPRWHQSNCTVPV